MHKLTNPNALTRRDSFQKPVEDQDVQAPRHGVHFLNLTPDILHLADLELARDALPAKDQDSRDTMNICIQKLDLLIIREQGQKTKQKPDGPSPNKYIRHIKISFIRKPKIGMQIMCANWQVR